MTAHAALLGKSVSSEYEPLAVYGLMMASVSVSSLLWRIQQQVWHLLQPKVSSCVLGIYVENHRAKCLPIWRGSCGGVGVRQQSHRGVTGCRPQRKAPRSTKDRWCYLGNQAPAKKNLTAATEKTKVQ